MDNIQREQNAKGIVLTSLRLPLELRDDLKKLADANGRSLNTHMVMTLKASVSDQEGAHICAG